MLALKSITSLPGEPQANVNSFCPSIVAGAGLEHGSAAGARGAVRGSPRGVTSFSWPYSHTRVMIQRAYQSLPGVAPFLPNDGVAPGLDRFFNRHHTHDVGLSAFGLFFGIHLEVLAVCP